MLLQYERCIEFAPLLRRRHNFYYRKYSFYSVRGAQQLRPPLYRRRKIDNHRSCVSIIYRCNLYYRSCTLYIIEVQLPFYIKEQHLLHNRGATPSYRIEVMPQLYKMRNLYYMSCTFQNIEGAPLFCKRLNNIKRPL